MRHLLKTTMYGACILFFVVAFFTSTHFFPQTQFVNVAHAQSEGFTAVSTTDDIDPLFPDSAYDSETQREMAQKGAAERLANTQKGLAKARDCSGPVDVVTCAYNDLVTFLNGMPARLLLFLAQTIYMTAALFAVIGGMILNLTLWLAITNIKVSLPMAAIESVWIILRDISNTALVFILLYTAINVMIGNSTSEIKKTIINIFIVAISINFSLFVTKTVVDVSNITSLAIYNRIITAPQSSSVEGADNFAATYTEVFAEIATEVGGGIAGKYVQALNVAQSIVDPTKALAEMGAATSNEEIDKAATNLANAQTAFVRVLVNALILIWAGILMLVSSLFFLIRFVVIIFLLMLSPIAFVAIAFPQMDKIKGPWISNLYGIALFPPVFFLFIFISLKVLVALNLQSELPAMTGGAAGGAAAMGIAIASSVFRSVLNGIVLFVPLIAATVFSFAGSGTALKAVNSAKLWAGNLAARNTAGRLGTRAESFLEKKGWANGVYARRLRALTTQKAKDVSIGGFNSLEKAGKEEKESKKIKTAISERETFMGHLNVTAKEKAATKERDKHAVGSANYIAQEKIRAEEETNRLREVRQYLNEADTDEIKTVLGDANAKQKETLQAAMPEAKITAMEKDKDGRFTSDLSEINKTRLGPITAILKAPPGPSDAKDIHTTVKGISAETLARLDIKDKLVLAERSGHALTGDKYKAVTKDLDPTDKAQFDKNINEFFRVPGNGKYVADLGDDITRISDDTFVRAAPAPGLPATVRAELIEALNPNLLSKLHGKKRQTLSLIGEYIRRTPGFTGRDAMLEYITSGSGKSHFVK